MRFVAAAFAAVIAFASAALPADRGDWFKSLKQPINGQSCCDVSDCTRTEAEWRGKQWWAIVRKKWTAIPPSVVVHNPHTIDGDAYVCSNPELAPAFNSQGGPQMVVVNPLTIYCFIPPDFGS